MPILSRFLIRASLLYFAAITLLGGALLINKAMPFNSNLWRFYSLHIEWAFVGWIIQLVLGVACWIFPKPPGGVRHIWLGWVGFVLINAALIALPTISTVGIFSYPNLKLISHLFQILGILAIAGHLWIRIGFLPAFLKSN